MSKKTNRKGLLLMLMGLLLIVAALLLVLYNNWESDKAGKASEQALTSLSASIFEKQMNQQQKAVPVTAPPTMAPTDAPTATPIVTDAPTATLAPTNTPTKKPRPTAVPTATPEPTPEPSPTPTPVIPPIWDRVPGYEMPVEEAEVAKDVNLKFVGILNIPALGLELPVQSTWSYEKLAYTPCRYAGNVYNDGFVIIAHRFESHFGSISSLPIGTTVNFTDMNGNTFRFRTVSIETLNADQTEELLSDEYAMTLMTCTLSSAQRIVVRCERR